MFLAATAVKIDSKQDELKKLKNIDEKAHYKCRPSDLPIYASLHSIEKSKSEELHPEDSAVRKALESRVCAARLKVLNGINTIAAQKKNVVELVDIGKEHCKSIFDYINEPDNNLLRTGVIAFGGLSGFILGLRGGYKRRLIYTSVGSGAIASLCYSKLISEVSESMFDLAKNAEILIHLKK